MKKGILIGAVALVALAAAPALWLLLDSGGGDRRSAALVEPTAGAADVGKLSGTGQISGAFSFPVQSFSWGLTIPRDATGQATGQHRYKFLQIIKPIDAISPVLFKMLTNNENIPTAKLELQASESTGVPTTYLTYTLTNANVASWDDGSSETLTLTFESIAATYAKGSTRPLAQAKQVIGQMTASGLGAGPVPIIGFATGVVSPRDPASGLPTGKRQHKPVVVRRAIDGLDAAVLTKAAQNATLGTITIERQRPDGSVATYTYTNARAVSVEDAGAAGAGVSTQELQFVYEKVDIKIGGVLASDDWETPVA